MENRAFVCAVFFIAVLDLYPVAAQTEPASQTAQTSFDCAVRSLGDAEYNDAAVFAAQAELYDPLLADSCYVKALAGIGSGAAKADVIVHLENAFVRPHWLYYNVTAARGLYALLLCDTGRFDEALASAPADTADGLLAKIRAFYGKKRIYDARDILRTALSRFPFDMRFCSVFFENEKNVLVNPDPDSRSGEVVKLRDIVFSHIDLFDVSDPHLVMQAVPFLADTEKASRVVAACRAAGYHNPESTYHALRLGLIDDTSALHELITAASLPDGISFTLLQDIVPLMRSDDTVRALSSWLYLFEGTIIDTQQGLLTITYSRGRPAVITFDKNNDGIFDFVVHCNNGTPESIIVSAFDTAPVTFTYGTYPYIAKAETNGSEYLFAPRALSWSPVVITHAALNPLPFTFFMPRPDETSGNLYQSTLFKNCSIIRRPITERPDAIEQIEMVNGCPYSSVRFVDGMPYSLGKYRDGYLETRSVDIDNDGSFEGFEVYAWDPGDKDSHLTHFYIDRNRNGKPEYSETFGDMTTYSWDTDDDGIVDIEYRIMEDGRAVTFYRHPVTHQNIEIISYNKKPLSISVDGSNEPIFQGAGNDFYWVSALPSPPDSTLLSVEEKIRSAYFETSGGQNVCIVAVDDIRYMAAFSGGLFFAEMQE